MNENLIIKTRTTLNILFMIGAFIAIILYFIPTVDGEITFYICAVSLFLKMIELVLRTFTKFNSRRR